jgi:GDP-mannose 6-dehydrogenase
MKVSVFGLGYVGCVTAACLAKEGHVVRGVDISPDKVHAILAGRSPVVEEGLGDTIAAAVRQGRLTATEDPLDAVRESDVSLVCVGTPSKGNGSLSLVALEEVTRQIGEAMRAKDGRHCIVYRSTVLPGTVRNRLIPLLEKASGLRAHQDFDVCFNPEFLREGSSIKDFYTPAFTVIGEENPRGGDVLARLYAGVAAPVVRGSYEVAELLKYACNAFHALKVAFANEIGVFCKAVGIDSHEVMDVFRLDRKLNISEAYLRPGFAFGGSCLPKDLRALLYHAKERDVEMPLLGSVLPSNDLHIRRAAEWIMATKQRKVGVLGLSFKPGTDDLRESPIVSLVETLIGKGCHLKVFDSDVSLSRLVGANKRYIEQEIPHISTLMSDDLHEVIEESDVLVVCKTAKEFSEALEPYAGKKLILDLARIGGSSRHDGLCW